MWADLAAYRLVYARGQTERPIDGACAWAGWAAYRLVLVRGRTERLIDCCMCVDGLGGILIGVCASADLAACRLVYVRGLTGLGGLYIGVCSWTDCADYKLAFVASRYARTTYILVGVRGRPINERMYVCWKPKGGCIVRGRPIYGCICVGGLLMVVYAGSAY